MSATFPKIAEISKVLQLLLGEAPPLNEDGQTPSFEELGKTYTSLCKNDAGEVVAALVADLPAALYLGGKLMMMPVARLEEQAKAGDMDQGVLDALTEVFNNLSSCLNEIDGNPHVRSTQAEETDSLQADDRGSWMPSATNRTDLTGNFLNGAGRLVLVAK